MKIVLIQTPWSEASAREYKGVAKRYALYPPLGLACLASAAEESGHEADIIDLECEDYSFDELCQRIQEKEYDLIGLTATSPVFHIAKDLAAALKKRLGLPIVIGGSHVNVLRREAFADEFDYAIIHEGETALPEFMDCLENKGDLSQILGLIYRENGEVKVNALRTFTKNLDDLPMPARHKLNSNNYVFEVPGRGVIPVGTIELTRGCPFKCVFCSEPLNTGKVLRRRSPKSVVDEFIHAKENFGITHFMTLDSTLTLNRKLIEGICHELIERNAGVTWEGQTRANLVDEPLLQLLKKAGLTRLSFGVESADVTVLKNMKKEVDPEAMRRAFRLCREVGISTLCGLMMGNPSDTRETIFKTAWFVRSIPEIRYAPMAIAIPYPGTELAYMAENNMFGLKLLSKDYTQYSRYAGGVMEVNGMGPGELVKIQRRALFIIHSTPTKILGLFRHFGFFNVLKIGATMLTNEIITMFGGKEPVLRKQNVVADNTTLKSLGLTSGNL